MSNRTFVINFIGAPGTGKTTICSLVFAHLKIAGYVVEYVQEYAKKLVWEGQFEILNNQHYVTAEQYKLLKSIDGKVQIITTDGPLIHGLYYNRHNPDNMSNAEKTEVYILEKNKEFNNINIFLEKGDFPYERQGRTQTEEEAKEIDVLMKYHLNKNNIPFKLFKASPDTINEIIEYIKSQMQ